LDLVEWAGRLESSYVAEMDGELVALAIFARRSDGRLFVQMDTRDTRKFKMMWQMRRIIREAERPLYAACEDLRYPSAPRFLRLIGFKETDETLNGKKVWVVT
jgi:hypothetical protein